MKTDRIEYSILLINFPCLLLNVKYSTERHSVYNKTDSFWKIILNSTKNINKLYLFLDAPNPRICIFIPPPFFFWSCIYVHESRYHYIINTEVLNFPMCMAEAMFTKRYFRAKAQILLHVSSHLITITDGITTALELILRVGR